MSGLLMLCSGQGGQHGAMFDLARTSADAAALLDQAGVKADPATMFDNAVAQPAIVAGALALWEALRARLPAPALVAGYSIGELAAWSVAGAIAPQDAIAVSRIRASAMDAAARSGAPQALVACSGLPVAQVEAVAAAHGFEAAIVNGYDAVIAGGLEADLEAFGASVAQAGGKLQRLPVTVASHTSLMAPAVNIFQAALQGANFQTPRCAVLSGVSAVPLTTKAEAVHDLARQLVQTIRWSDCMDAAQEAGISVALELGPGAALARMMQARQPGIACRSVADFRSIDGIVAWIERQLEL